MLSSTALDTNPTSVYWTTKPIQRLMRHRSGLKLKGLGANRYLACIKMFCRSSTQTHLHSWDAWRSQRGHSFYMTWRPWPSYKSGRGTRIFQLSTRWSRRSTSIMIGCVTLQRKVMFTRSLSMAILGQHGRTKWLELGLTNIWGGVGRDGDTGSKIDHSATFSWVASTVHISTATLMASEFGGIERGKRLRR